MCVEIFNLVQFIEFCLRSQVVQAALDVLMRNRTVLIIAHRLNTVKVITYLISFTILL